MSSMNMTSEVETQTRVLIVEDMPWDADLMRHELVRNGMDAVTLRVEAEPEFREALAEFKPEIILADHSLPRFSGMRALQIVQELRLDVPMILVSGAVTEQFALECLQAGVADYLLKDNLLRLGPAVKTALESARVRRAKDAAQGRAQALATIVQDSLSEIYVFSADTLRFLFVNRAAEQNLGYTPEEILGLTPVDIEPEITQEGFEVLLRSLRAGEAEHLVFQTVHRRKDETEYPVEAHVQRWEYMGEPAFVAFVLDLEERRRAEQESEALGLRLAAFADSTVDAMIVADAEGLVRFWNRAATFIFGFYADEMMGRPLLTLIPERFHAEYEVGMEAALRGEASSAHRPQRTMGLHKDGAEVPIELTRGSWNEGEEGFVSFVVRDITERVRAEERLRASQEHYRTLLENLPVVTYESALDSKSSTLWLSPQIEDLLGTPAVSWTQDPKLFLKRIHPDDRARVVKAVAAGHASGSMDIEYRIAHESGRYVWVRDQGVVGPSVQDDGSLVFRGVMRDVTAAKESERERALLSAAVEQSSNLMMITDTAGDIQYVNRAFETITGYSRDEAVGRNPRFLKSGRQSEAFYEEMWAELTAGRSWTSEFVNRRKDGTEYSQRSTIFAISDAQGGIQNFVGIGEDVTNELALQRQLRQAQKMEAVGQLTGGIAHDFNNVLAAILTNAQLLSMALPPELADEVAEARDIEYAARRGADLIRRLMAFSRDDHLDLEVIDPSDVLQETVRLLRSGIPENVQLTLDEAHEGALISVDRTAIQQILLNLGTNARDAMPEGGKLAISTCVSDRWVEIKVRDTGVGMDAHVLERAFDPFFTTKDEGKGTGLGLAMVQKLVERHGGDIQVASEPGAGTTFTVRLPLAETGAPEPRKRRTVKDTAEAHAGKTLLFVEDEGTIRRAGRRILERVGYTVLLADNGRHALEILEERGPEISLVVTDLIMPEVGGAELYDATRNWEPRPAFLATSGYMSHEMGGSIMKDDDVLFLRKPWDATDLVDAVGRALDQAAAIDVRAVAEPEGS